VIFETYRDQRETRTITEYNTLEEAKEETKLLNIFYSPTPKPVKVNASDYYSRSKYRDNKYHYEYPEDSKFWGWVLLDFNKCDLQVGGQGLYGGKWVFLTKKELKSETWLDKFFRKPTEVQEDYEWDDGEYSGWLRFRWGDGKNAIGYQEPPKTDQRPGKDEYRDIWDEVNQVYRRQKYRVVVLKHGEPLPEKRYPGVRYEYTDGAPVIFPGEFGYSEEEFPDCIPEINGEIDSYLRNQEPSKGNTLMDSINLDTSKGVKAAIWLNGSSRS
jgi:hypothetical protein